MRTLAQAEMDAYEAMYSSACNERQGWQDLSDYVSPKKSAITGTKTHNIDEYAQEVYDDEAVHANNTLASGQMDYMVSGKWFGCEPPKKDAPQDARDWYAKAGETCLEVLLESNFNLQVHETFKDRGGFGICFLQTEEDEEDVLHCKSQTVGNFYVEENEKGLVDTVRRCIKMTARQAKKKFGIDPLGKEMIKCLRSQDQNERQQKFDVIHTIRPRDEDERSPGKIDAKNMPWASIYVCKQDEVVLRNSGYLEQPFTISRFETWGDSPYGWSPGHLVLTSIRQVQNIERDMDAVSEVQAFPRVLSPKGAVPKVKLHAGGVTVWNPGVANGAEPKEWLTNGDLRGAAERAESKRDRIRRAYFVDLFQMLTNMDEVKREKTAYEVGKMLHEKITRISPTFERIKVEMFKPFLTRVFNICYRRGLFAEPPESVRKMMPNGSYIVPAPRYSFTSKLAMAIKSAENITFLEWWEMMGPVMEVVGPEEFVKNLNFTRMVRLSGENHGVTVDFFNTEEERKEMEATIAAQKQAEQQMAMAESGSKVAANMSKVPPQVLDRVQERTAQAGGY